MWDTTSTWRDYWLEVAWVAFAVGNLALMLLLPEWQAIPFHLIWVSLTVLYGFRLWAPKPTALLLLAVGLATATIVLTTGQPAAARLNEFFEVPLMSAMFMVMVWHARRRGEALVEVRRAAARERDFVRDASHRLRTPITVARGHAELIRAGAAPGSQIERDADIVLGELAHLGRMSDRLLILAAAENPGFLMLERVQLSRLIEDAADRWIVVADREWAVEADATGTVLVDRERVDGALDALIENAIKATERGCEVTLRAVANETTPVLVVADRGVGIESSDFDQIFQRFARLPGRNSGAPRGTGLGLPIVKAIAAAHGGSVSVTSKPGGWTTFELRLARFEPPTPPGATEPLAAAPAA